MKKILAIGAHPDDVEFGAGGLLIKELENGAEVTILVCSYGEAGTNGTPESRKKEAEDAAAYIGAKTLFIDLGGDCHITEAPKNALAIAEVIRTVRPDIILAPSQAENQHPDHLVVSHLARSASRLARYGGLAELKALPVHAIEAIYYFPSSAEMDKKPDILIDVSAHYEKWVASMTLHESQMQTRGYINIVSSKARAYGASIGVEYAAVLWTNDPVRVSTLSAMESSRKY